MSTQAARQFLEKVAGDPALQNRIAPNGGDATERLAAAVEAGRQHGFAFTGDEFVSVIKAEMGPADALSEPQLAQVTGGTFKAVVGKIYNWMGGGGGGDSGGGSAVGVRG